ncbi:MAG: LEA type 2 family protein [Blastocatellia bacterium]
MTGFSNAPRRRRWKLWAGLLVFAALAVVGALYFIPGYLRSGVTFTLESVSLPEPEANSSLLPRIIGEVTTAAKAVTGTGDVLARVRVRNAMPFSSSVSSARYVVLINEKEAGRGSWAPKDSSIALPSGQEVVLDLPFQIDPQSVAGSTFDALRGKPLAFKLKGEATISVMGLSFNAPFYLSPMQVSVGQPK